MIIICAFVGTNNKYYLIKMHVVNIKIHDKIFQNAKLPARCCVSLLVFFTRFRYYSSSPCVCVCVCVCLMLIVTDVAECALRHLGPLSRI